MTTILVDALTIALGVGFGIVFGLAGMATLNAIVELVLDILDHWHRGK